MPQWLFNVIVIGGIAGIIVYKAIKNKNDEWEGELTNKWAINNDEDSLSTTVPTSFMLVFKTDKGKKKRVVISNSDTFEQWKKGDRVIKRKGERIPEKI